MVSYHKQSSAAVAAAEWPALRGETGWTMAKGTRLSPERAAAWLVTVHDDLARLPRAEQRWTDPRRSPIERERDQQATFHEWQATVERFELLASAFLAGNLPPEMAQPFADVVDQLQRILPTVERLGLQRPPAALMERLATRLARSVA
jgi:hypothetical protein